MRLMPVPQSSLILIEHKHGYRLFCSSSALLMDLCARSWQEAFATAQRLAADWPAPADLQEGDQRTVFLTVCLTSECNLSCQYCYLHGAYPDWPVPDSPTSSTFSVEPILEEIRSILDRRPQCFELNFFGGEPLLARTAINVITRAARERSRELGIPIRIGVTTNGTLVDSPFLEWCAANDVTLMVSLDCPPNLHDRFRAHGHPGADFASISARLRGFEARTHFVTTITHQTPTIRSALEPLLNLGAQLVFFNLVHTRDAALALQPRDARRFVGELQDAQDWYSSVSSRLGNLRRICDLLSGQRAKEHPCAAGKDGYAIAPSGDRYFCHSCVNQPDYALDSSRRPRSSSLQVRLLSTRHDPACERCWARRLCGGDCWLIRWHYSQAERRTRCTAIRAIARLALSIYEPQATLQPSRLAVRGGPGNLSEWDAR
jgi:uncharacterized protein